MWNFHLGLCVRVFFFNFCVVLFLFRIMHFFFFEMVVVIMDDQVVYEQ